jgi:hypothetical protein
MRCNSSKQDVEVLDPTASPLAEHLRIEDDGSIHALSLDGQDLIDLLGLDRESRARVRRFYLDLVALKRELPEDHRVDRLFMEAFAYPELADLPELTALKPPGGNKRKGSEQTSFHSRRKAGKLPVYY